MEKKSVEKSGNIVINTNAVKISNSPNKKKRSSSSAGEKKRALNNREIQLALIENFVSMQRVLTNLTARFEMMSDNISKLLQLFEISAKTFMQKHNDAGSLNASEEGELLKKLDVMLEQNKTVAKGITLIEEKIRHRIYGDLPKDNQNPRPLHIGEKPQPGMPPRI